MDRVLVTGGAGFIGSHLVRGLLDDGYAVRVLDDFSTGRRENLEEVASRIEVMEGDVRDRGAVDRALAGCAAVLHQAALPSVERSVRAPVDAHEVNAGGTLNCLEACRALGIRRFVYAGSSSAYGDTPTLPKREDMAPNPLSPYAVSKLAGEQFCAVYRHVHGIAAVALRYFNVFGPRQDPASEYAAAVPRFITSALAGRRPVVFGDGEQSRDFTHVRNVVAANLLALRAPEACWGETFNIGCGERITVNRMIATIGDILGTGLEPETAPPRAGDVRHSLASVEKAERLLGYRVVCGFREGLEETIAWFRQVGTR